MGHAGCKLHLKSPESLSSVTGDEYCHNAGAQYKQDAKTDAEIAPPHLFNGGFKRSRTVLYEQLPALARGRRWWKSFGWKWKWPASAWFGRSTEQVQRSVGLSDIFRCPYALG